MCDLAHAVLLEQFEGDAQAMIAAGAQGSVADARQSLEDELRKEVPTARPLRGAERDDMELRRALGVA